MARYPERVTIYEVGPRDGLQNEAAQLPPAVKIEFIDRLSAAGLSAIEATSFVSPKAVPQLADASEVFAGITRRPGVRYPVLVPNLAGYERARAVGAQEIAVFTAASESFNQANIRCGIDESFARFAPVVTAAKADGLRIRGYVSTAFHCPYEGPIEPAAAMSVVTRLFAMGVDEVSIGDTIGAAVPTEVAALLATARATGVDFARLALHFHDTRGTALANLLVGLEQGIAIVDASAGGLGGCPYAPGAAGNVSTEDVVYMLEGMGIATGVDFEALCAATRFVGAALSGRILASRALTAGRPRTRPRPVP